MISEDTFALFAQRLNALTGIHLAQSQIFLADTRLSLLAQEIGVGVNEYVMRFLNSTDQEMINDVVNTMTTNETHWFREQEHFDFLTQNIFPKIAKKPNNPLAIMSAACSSGEEVYSLSMQVQRYIEQAGLPPETIGAFIEGCDISKDMVKVAKGGIYSSLDMSRGLDAEARSAYFNKVDNERHSVKSTIKYRTNFHVSNLVNDDIMSDHYDVIFCRNVLLYFSEQTKREVTEKLIGALKTGGFLFLSATEFIPNKVDGCKMISKDGCFAYQKTQSTPKWETEKFTRDNFQLIQRAM